MIKVSYTEGMAKNISHYCKIQNRIAWLFGATAISFLLCSEPGIGSVSDDLRFETSAFMKSTAYRRPDRVAIDAAPSGAESSVNIQWERSHLGKWYIEEQRYGADAICAGIAQEDSTAIERG